MSDNSPLIQYPILQKEINNTVHNILEFCENLVQVPFTRNFIKELPQDLLNDLRLS